MTEAENVAAYERVHERIQVGVNKNPILSKTVSKALLHCSSALLWNRKDYQDIENSSPIYIISQHHIHCVLMPWIAKHYPWVLEDHPDCQERPLGLFFVDNYANNRRLRSHDGDDVNVVHSAMIIR
jgi:hypothetical protein